MGHYEPHPKAIDLTELVAAITSLACKPYTAFLGKLHAEQRITDAEITQLREVFEDLAPRLPQLIKAQLLQAHSPAMPQPLSGQA